MTESVMPSRGCAQDPTVRGRLVDGRPGDGEERRVGRVRGEPETGAGVDVDDERGAQRERAVIKGGWKWTTRPTVGNWAGVGSGSATRAPGH